MRYPLSYEDNVDSRLPPKNMVNNQVNAYKDIKGVDDNGKNITKEKSCTQKDQQATVKVADVTKHENKRNNQKQNQQNLLAL